jgi:hypothetical protein
MLIGIRDARRDRDIAQQQFADAQALLQAPPIDTSVLQTKLDAASADLAMERALAAPPSVDPAADEAAALLVRRSEAAGLSVKGISRMAPTTAKLTNGSFNVQGIRLSIEGGVPQVLALLADLHNVEPSLIPVLAGMTISEAGVARADIGFDTYTPMATPTAVAPARRKAAS